VILHASAVDTNQLASTPHLHDQLSEKVSISLVGAVIPSTKSDTLLVGTFEESKAC
jgi:hypothetical protein